METQRHKSQENPLRQRLRDFLTQTARAVEINGANLPDGEVAASVLNEYLPLFGLRSEGRKEEIESLTGEYLEERYGGELRVGGNELSQELKRVLVDLWDGMDERNRARFGDGAKSVVDNIRTSVAK